MSIELPNSVTSRARCTPQNLGSYIYKQYMAAKQKRSSVENTWDTVYALYRAGVEDMRELQAASFTTGSTRNWKHRVNTGKTLEVIETLVAYFTGATFPSDDWFSVSGTVPELAEVSKLVKELTKQKLTAANVMTVVEEFIRDYCLFGFAVLYCGWQSSVEVEMHRVFSPEGIALSSATNVTVEKLDLQTVSPYDVWLPSITSEEGIFRRLRLSRQQFNAYVEEGYYTVEPEMADRYTDESWTDPRLLKRAMTYPPEILEYYGKPFYDGTQFRCTHAVFFNNTLIRLADSDYWSGSPYITATMMPNKDSLYGMSVIHAALGSLHTNNVLTNGRLDNIAIYIDRMLSWVDDGIMRKEDIYCEPGKVFQVAQHGNIQPIDLGPPTFTVTYQEGQLQEQAVDRVCSVGPMVSSGLNQNRDRVTAQEIIATQQSGGNRLSMLHRRLEANVTLPMLSKVFMLLQQYYIDPELVRIYAPELDTDAFFSVLPEYLQYPYRYQLVPTGAAYVVEKQRTLADIMQLLDVSSRVPGMIERLDMDKLLVEILQQLRFRNPMSFIKPAPQSQPLPQPEPPNLEQSLGGEPMKIGVEQQLAAGGGQQMLQNVGVNTEDVPPEVLNPMIAELAQGALQ